MTEEEFVVEMTDVYKNLGGKQVLDGLNLSVNRGETLVVLGRSGEGKSVTLKHMVGLMKPDRGTIRLFGTDLSSIDRKELLELRKRVGFLFQGGGLLGSLSVYENIALPLREHTDLSEEEIKREVEEKLELVGLDDIGESMPSVLSGGMRKRVALARAIIRNPEIILYDEPTHGLDPIMASRINTLTNRLKRQLDTTSVVVTHDIPSALKIADRLAMLYEGKIVSSGEPVEFLESEDPLIKQFMFGGEESVNVS